MAASDQQVARYLNNLRRLCMAGERGFEVVARNVTNRGLKVLLKSYAQQRADFAAALQAEIKALGGKVSGGRSIRGVIHRGRINIRGALTIGPLNVEQAVLGETKQGEKAVARAYESVLSKDLPAGVRELVQSQFDGIRAVGEELELLKRRGDRQLVVRLFDSESDAGAAIAALESAGFSRDDIETVDMNRLTIYEGEGSTVGETIASGAFGGALWGGLVGAVAGISVLFIPMMAGNAAMAWGLIALAGLFFGALFGAILGWWIGLGISEADVYIYDSSIRHGAILLRLLSVPDRSTEATRILHEINCAARARGRSQPAPGPELRQAKEATG